MKNNKGLTSLGLAIFFAILSGITLFMGLRFPKLFFEDYTDSNTVEYCLTVKSVETNEKSNTVFVEEFDCGLWFYFEEIMCEDYLEELKPGTKITVKIPKIWEEVSFNSAVGIPLAAIKTENMQIVTLESHNTYAEKGHNQLLSAIYLFFSIFIILTVVCFVLFLVKRKHK